MTRSISLKADKIVNDWTTAWQQQWIQEILLDCNQSNVLFARIIFSYTLSSAFFVFFGPLRRTVRRSGTAMELWRLKDKGVTTLNFWGHVTSPVTCMTILLAVSDFLLVVHCDHGSIWQGYGDMAVWSSSRKALTGTEVSRWSVIGRSILNITLISYTCTPLRFLRNVAREEYKKFEQMLTKRAKTYSSSGSVV